MVEVEAMEGPSDAELLSVAELARVQIAKEAEVARIEAELAAAKRELAAVRDEALPKAMDSVGVADYTLTDGSKVSVRKRYVCGQLDDGPDREEGRPLDDRLEALRWLDDNGHGDISRRVITVTLGADAEQTASELIALLKSHKQGNRLMIDHRRTVPWNTLASFSRKQLEEEASDIPLDTLGVTVMRSAKITHPKEKE
jgi:uncharacterized small protein (DUF1192 family)